MKIIEILLLISIGLTGLSAGLGFANLVGYIPAMKNTPAPHLISFWKNADHYFRARMPLFGNTLLLSLLLCLILLRRDWQSPSFLFIALSLLACIGDLVIVLTKNLPLNKIVQALDPEETVRPDFELIRTKAVKAYYFRAILNLVSFVLALTGVAMYLSS